LQRSESRERFERFGPWLALALFASALPALAAQEPIDREALVARHAPTLRAIDYAAPLTVGNGGFALSVDSTGLQTFGDAYYERGIPLETLARWCWASDDNPNGYTLDDASRDYAHADGSTIRLPT